MKKYEKVFRSDYEQWYREHEAYRDQVRRDPDRLHYHLMPETGWLNDPNGLCQFCGTYHIYYQYTPFEPTGELKLWGHYTTKDFVSFESREPALFPDEDFDAHGVYSGSALVENGEIHYFYTGNVKYFDRDDYDYIQSGRGSNVVHLTSRDGFQMSPKELLMTTDDYPEDISCHVRDPKIFRRGTGYYMVLGARDKSDKGMALLYFSENLKNWTFVNRITTREPFGYMWECPDLFELDGQLLLISCPQGVAHQGIDYANVYQCTAMKLAYNFDTNQYAIDEDIQQLDRGFDFYAPQTFQDEQGRRILIGWMGIPDAPYTNPTVRQGWQHALTIPRVLHVKNGRLYQQPLEELKALRSSAKGYNFTGAQNWDMDGLCFEAEIVFESCQSLELTLRRGVTLSYNRGILTLDLGPWGSGRTTRSVAVPELQNLRIFSDTTSLEIFVNNGAQVFTTRVYSREPQLSVDGHCTGCAMVYHLRPVTVQNNQ